MQRIELLDTTLRDGAQGEGVEHSLSDKRKIAPGAGPGWACP